ncbi:MAG: PqiC family protein [Pseudomonadota bacterium]|nr:PqiC family protein [Pseudomonadota bacterium]
MFRSLFILFFMTVLTGCSSTPSQFYVLTEIPPYQVRPLAINESSTIGLGPIEFPKYLDQPQIVIRKTQNKLDMNEFHRWAEPLDENTRRVLRNNLSNLLKSSRVVMYPWRHSDKVDYQIRVDITRFDSDECGNVILMARWQILDSDDKEVLSTHTRTYRECICQKYNYDDLARTMSNLLARFSRDLALGIQKV